MKIYRCIIFYFPFSSHIVEQEVLFHHRVRERESTLIKLLRYDFIFLQIIEAVTASPALAIGRSNDLGSLGLGREADITILKVVPFEHQMEDSFGVVKRVQKAILPVAVWRAGRNYPIEKRSHDPTVG